MRTIATYLIQVMSPVGESVSDLDIEQREKRVLADLPSIAEEVEENVTDMLPEGFEARVTSWDEERDDA